ncbi:MAG: hypothetical protein JSU87_10495 [Gemmatimonadota bacterium]|nr:MAG: hypothetical protein JSU87_10495 [Gemmatimonadota bacterium]
MILSTLLRPSGNSAETESKGEAPEAKRVLPQTRERSRRYDRALAIGVICSVLVHVLAVRLSPLIVRYLEAPFAAFPISPPSQVRAEGMRALEIRVTETTEPVEPRPLPEPEAERPEPGPVAVETGPRLSAAERLRPRVGDWRLWIVPPRTDRYRPTDLERAMALRARLYAALQAENDSLAAELAREMAALDWTIGEEGNKWGVSPGKIHLGGVTLPLPLYFAPHPATQRLEEDMLRDYEAIRRQAGQAEADEVFKDRVRAIRDRKVAEEVRREAQKDTTSGD